MNNDDFERASLSGKGRKLFGNRNQSNENETFQDDLQPNEEELSQLFDESLDLGTQITPELATPAPPQLAPRPEITHSTPPIALDDEFDLLEDVEDLAFEPLTPVVESELVPESVEEETILDTIEYQPAIDIESATEDASFAAIEHPLATDAPLENSTLDDDDFIEEDILFAPDTDLVAEEALPQHAADETPVILQGQNNPLAGDAIVPEGAEEVEATHEEDIVFVPDTNLVAEEALPQHAADETPVILQGQNNPLAGDAIVPEGAEEVEAIEEDFPIALPDIERIEALPPHEQPDTPIVILSGQTRLDVGTTLDPSQELTIEEAIATESYTDYFASEGLSTAEIAAVAFEDVSEGVLPDGNIPINIMETEPPLSSPPAALPEPDLDAANESIPFIEDVERPEIVNLHSRNRVNHPVVEEVIPIEAETLADSRNSRLVDGSGGVLAFPPRATIINNAMGPATEPIPTPFDPRERPTSKELFSPTESADPILLNDLVDDGRIHTLWNMIEILQEDIAEQVRLSPERGEIYQQELLQASDLLLRSRENYDDARAIVFRIRADLQREAQIEADIQRYTPILVTYIIGAFITSIVLGLLSAVVEDILQEIDAEFFAAAYLPTIFGVAGGLFLAYTTLNKHTAVLRDFDRAHIWWYFVSPLIGGLMGLMTFTLWLATVITTTTQEIDNLDTVMQYPAIVWVLAFLGGLQQNWVVNRLRALGNAPSEKSESTAKPS